MEKTITFFNYVMECENNRIMNVLDNSNKTTKFAWSFYQKNKEMLDNYENILEWVKQKREQEKHNSIVIDLDNLTLNYSGSMEKVSNEDLKVALKLVKRALMSDNEALNNLQNELNSLIASESTIKALMGKFEKGTPSYIAFDSQLKTINERIESTKKAIENEMKKFEM